MYTAAAQAMYKTPTYHLINRLTNSATNKTSID